MSPALAGGFFATETPGKALDFHFFRLTCVFIPKSQITLLLCQDQLKSYNHEFKARSSQINDKTPCEKLQTCWFCLSPIYWRNSFLMISKRLIAANKLDTRSITTTTTMIHFLNNWLKGPNVCYKETIPLLTKYSLHVSWAGSSLRFLPLESLLGQESSQE